MSIDSESEWFLFAIVCESLLFLDISLANWLMYGRAANDLTSFCLYTKMNGDSKDHECF